MEKTKRPVIKLESGRRVKSTFENEHYFFYNVRKKEDAEEICEKLKELGYNSNVGQSISGPTRWFANARHYDVFKD